MDWNDIAGLDLVKAVIKEEVLWPVLRVRRVQWTDGLTSEHPFIWTSGNRQNIIGQMHS